MNTTEEKEQQKPDFGLQCLMTIASYYRIPADAKNIIHLLAMEGKTFGDDDLLRGAKLLKIKAKSAEIIPEKLSKMTFPAMLKTNDGYLLILKADGERCLIISEENNAPHVITMEQLSKIWDGKILLFVPRMMQNRDVKFGFKWFIPTIIKYKTPLLEVLAAAFIMQVLGLLSPLITQSVIDKVLVHNSLSTLDVLAIGLLLIVVFETILSVARNYVFTHTEARLM